VLATSTKLLHNR